MGKIKDEQLRKLTEVYHRERPPNRKLLKWCFPNAFRSLKEHALSTKLDVWSFENVSSYWRGCHYHSGDCRVLQVKITNIDEKSRITVSTVVEGIVKPGFNPYDYEVTVGEVYYTHQLCLIEKAE